VVRKLKPDSIPVLKGKAAREFERKIREPSSPKKKWVLREASKVYRDIKEEK